MVCAIKFDTVEDAIKLNKIAQGHDGTLYVSCGCAMVDAKSLLALYTLVGRNNVKLVAPDHENPEKLNPILKQIITH